MRKRLIFITLLFVIVILSFLWIPNPSVIWEDLRSVSLPYLGLVIALYLVNLVMKAWRWNIILNTTARISLKRSFPYYVISLCFNNISPGKLGGEPIRAIFLRSEDGVPLGKGLATIVAEKVIDLSVITALAVVGTATIFTSLDAGSQLMIGSFLAGFSVFMMLIMYMIIKRDWESIVIRILKRFAKFKSLRKYEHRLERFVNKLSVGLREIAENPRVTMIVCILTLFIWLNEFLRLYIILRYVMPEPVDAAIGAVLVAVSIGTLVSLVIPAGAGNLIGMSAVLGAVGLELETVTAASLIAVATSIWLSVILGLVTLAIFGKKYLAKTSSDSSTGTDKDTEGEGADLDDPEQHTAGPENGPTPSRGKGDKG